MLLGTGLTFEHSPHYFHRVEIKACFIHPTTSFCVFEVIVLLKHWMVSNYQPSSWWFEVMMKCSEEVLIHYSIQFVLSVLNSCSAFWLNASSLLFQAYLWSLWSVNSTLVLFDPITFFPWTFCFVFAAKCGWAWSLDSSWVVPDHPNQFPIS